MLASCCGWENRCLGEKMSDGKWKSLGLLSHLSFICLSVISLRVLVAKERLKRQQREDNRQDKMKATKDVTRRFHFPKGDLLFQDVHLVLTPTFSQPTSILHLCWLAVRSWLGVRHGCTWWKRKPLTETYRLQARSQHQPCWISNLSCFSFGFSMFYLIFYRKPKARKQER